MEQKTVKKSSEYYREYRRKHIEKLRLYWREYRKKWRKLHGQEATIRWQKNNMDKMRAHDAVRRAKNKGVIISRPCVICGNNKSIAHHEDYKKPLDVVWLCKMHHIQYHEKIINLPK